MAEQLIAAVTSEKQPQSGQKNRSSGNFSISGLPSGTKLLKWEVEGGGNPDFIHFNVMKDVSMGSDPVIFSNVFSGNRTSVATDRSFYIANPGGATSSFTVKVYALY